MRTITVLFHDEREGLRDSVKTIASNAGAPVSERGTNKLDISCSGMSTVQSVWVELQAVEGVQISSNCNATENEVLRQAVQEAAKGKERTSGRRTRSSGGGSE